jgi:hypothetical protein
MADTLTFEKNEFEVLETFEHDEDVQRPEELRFYTLDEQLHDFLEKFLPSKKLSRHEEKELKRLRDRIRLAYENTIVVTDTDYTISSFFKNVDVSWIHPVYSNFDYNKYSFKKEWEPLFAKEQIRIPNYYPRLINALPKPYTNSGEGRNAYGKLTNKEGKEPIQVLDNFISTKGIINDDGTYAVETLNMNNSGDIVSISGYFLDERPFEIPRPFDHPFLKSRQSSYVESSVSLKDAYPSIETIMEHAIPSTNDPYGEGSKYLKLYGVSLENIPWKSWKDRFFPAEYRDVPIPIQQIDLKTQDSEKPSESILKVYNDWYPSYDPRFWLSLQKDGGTIVQKTLLSGANLVGSLSAFPYLGKIEYNFPETYPEICQGLLTSFDSFLESGLYRQISTKEKTYGICVPITTILQEKASFAYINKIPWKENTSHEIISSYKKILKSFINNQNDVVEIKYEKYEQKPDSERRTDVLSILKDEIRDDLDKAEALERITRDLELTDNIFYDLGKNFVLCMHTLEILKGNLKDTLSKLNFYLNWTLQIEGSRVCKFCGDVINKDTLVAVKEYDSDGHVVMEYQPLDSASVTLHSLNNLKSLFSMENSGESLLYLILTFLQIIPTEQQLLPILQLIRSFSKSLKSRAQQTGKISNDDREYTEGLFGIAGFVVIIQTHNPFLIPKRKIGTKQFDSSGYPRDSNDQETCKSLKSIIELLRIVIKTFPVLYKGGVAQVLRRLLKDPDDLKINALRWIGLFNDKFKTVFDSARERYEKPPAEENKNIFSLPSENLKVQQEISNAQCNIFKTGVSWRTKRLIVNQEEIPLTKVKSKPYKIIESLPEKIKFIDFSEKEIRKRLELGLSGFPFTEFIKTADSSSYVIVSNQLLTILRNSSFPLEEQQKFRNLLEKIDAESSLFRDISKGIFMELLFTIKKSQPLVRVILDSIKTDLTLKMFFVNKKDAEQQDSDLRAKERNTLKAALRSMNDAEREISQKTLALGISEFIITNKQREKFFKDYESLNEIVDPEEEYGTERDYIENGNLPVALDGTEMEVDYGDYGDRAVRDYNDYTEQHIIDED